MISSLFLGIYTRPQERLSPPLTTSVTVSTAVNRLNRGSSFCEDSVEVSCRRGVGRELFRKRKTYPQPLLDVAWATALTAVLGVPTPTLPLEGGGSDEHQGNAVGMLLWPMVSLCLVLHERTRGGVCVSVAVKN